MYLSNYFVLTQYHIILHIVSPLLFYVLTLQCCIILYIHHIARSNFISKSCIKHIHGKTKKKKFTLNVARLFARLVEGIFITIATIIIMNVIVILGLLSLCYCFNSVINVL